VARRKQEVDVADLSDVDLLERVVGRIDLDETDAAAFSEMLDRQRRREEEYGDDAYPLTDRQREWAERVARRPKTKMTGEEFAEVVRDTIGRDLKILRRKL